jgi:chitodextrinase
MLPAALALSLVFTACPNLANTPEDTTPPAKVTGLDAAPGNGQATLTWTDPTDTDFHHVEITFTPEVTGVTQPITVAKGIRSRTITGLANGTAYTFTVKAVDDSGNKSEGASITATPSEALVNDETPPAKVTNLAAEAGNGQATLTWTDPADTDLAAIEITFVPAVTDVTQPITVVKGVQSRTVTGLANGTAYTFTVKAVDDSGSKSEGASTTATPSEALVNDETPPAKVTNLAATPGNGEATLAWTDPADTDLASIEITFTPAVTGVDQPITVAKGVQSKIVTGLANETAYNFTVIAVDVSGNKSAGATATATPEAPIGNETVAALIEEGSKRLVAQSFDSAVQYYESAYAKDSSDPAAIVYSSIAKLASIAKDQKIQDLMKNRFGLSSYPGSIDALVSGSWLEEYPDEQFVPWYYDDGWVDWYGEHPKTGGLFGGGSSSSGWYTSFDRVLDESEYAANGPGYYREEFVKSSYVWVSGEPHYSYDNVILSPYYDANLGVNLYWSEEGAEWMNGEDSGFVEETGYHCRRYEYKLFFVSKTPRYEPRGYSLFPAFDTPQWVKDNGDYNASLNSGNIPGAVTMQLLLFSNLVDKNTNGLNDLLDQTLDAVFGANFEEAAARVAKLNYNQSVFLDGTIVDKFGLTEIFEGDMVITKVEMELLIASLRLVKAALEWIDAYDWNTDLNFLKVNWVNNVDASYDALLANIRNTTLPLKNNFLTDRNNGKMAASKEDFIKAIDAAIDAYDNIGKVALMPPGAKDEITSRQWIKAGLTALKSAINDGQTFWIPNREPTGSGWNYSAANGAIGVNLKNLFTPGYLSLDKLIENSGGTPVMYGFQDGESVAISSKKDIANYEAFGFKFKTARLYGGTGVVMKIDGADVRADYAGSLFPADIAEALWDAYHK